MEINVSFLPLSHYKETVGSSFKAGVETISRAIKQSQMDVTVSLLLFSFLSFFGVLPRKVVCCSKDCIQCY